MRFGEGALIVRDGVTQRVIDDVVSLIERAVESSGKRVEDQAIRDAVLKVRKS